MPQPKKEDLRSKLLLKSIIIGGALLYFFSVDSWANDGADRHRGRGPNLFYLFPEPLGPEAGYRILDKDGPGGADGKRAYRWAQPQAIALVRIAAFETYRVIGPAPFAMTIFDLSAENGDTPVDFSSKNSAQGRHPGDSHDGGLNLDLGYYLTSLKGQQFSPDHAACSDHFEKNTSKDAHICNGPADRLATKQQAFFVAQLFLINQNLFQRDLIEEIGMDYQVQQKLLPLLIDWAQKHQYNVTKEIVDDVRRTLIADRWDGWSHSHHHHLHLRLRDISTYGRYRQSFSKLYEQEREVDRKLREFAKTPSPSLRTRLLSIGLQRSVETELLDKYRPAQVKFRAANGEWIDSDPSSAGIYRAVIDLPDELHQNEQLIDVEVEAKYATTPAQRTKNQLLAPGLFPHLSVTIDPSRIKVIHQVTSGTLNLSLEIPEVYRVYVTRVFYDLYRGEKRATKTTFEGKGQNFAVKIKTALSPLNVRLIKARVLLSGRKVISIPVYQTSFNELSLTTPHPGH